jgi:hypothetical protein
MTEYSPSLGLLTPSQESYEIGARLGLTSEEVEKLGGYLDLLLLLGSVPEGCSAGVEETGNEEAEGKCDGFDMRPLSAPWEPSLRSVCAQCGYSLGNSLGPPSWSNMLKHSLRCLSVRLSTFMWFKSS